VKKTLERWNHEKPKDRRELLTQTAREDIPRKEKGNVCEERRSENARNQLAGSNARCREEAEEETTD